MLVSSDAWEQIVKNKGLQAGQHVMFLYHPSGDIVTARSRLGITVDVI
jgi:hypothetical protein